MSAREHDEGWPGTRRARTDDRDTVQRSDSADVVGGGDGTTNGRLLLLSAVLDALAGEVGSAALACLQTVHQLLSILRRMPARIEMGRRGMVVHDRGLVVTGSLKSSNDSAAGGDVGGGNGEALLAGIGEELEHVVAYFTVNLNLPLSDLGEEFAP
jgi:hypothetical protein